MSQRRSQIVPPPPVLFAAAFGTGLLIQRNSPLLLPDYAWVRGFGVLLMLFGVVVASAAILEFRRHKTTIRPGAIASAFVTTGPYRFTRNPMYLSVSCFYAGLTFFFCLGWPLLLLPVAIIAIQLLVIRAEERHLADRFGPDYLAYKHRVRRWL